MTGQKPRVAAPTSGDTLTTVNKRVLEALKEADPGPEGVKVRMKLLEEIFAAPNYEAQLEIMGNFVEFVPAEKESAA